MTFAGNEIQFTASAVMDLGAVGMGKDCAVVMDGSDPLVGIVYKAGATATMSGMTVMFEETGVYFLYNAQYGVGVSSLVINNYTGFETTEVIKIPSKFIPEHEPEAVFTIESSEMGNLNDDGKVITCNKSIVELISKTELTSVRVKWNGYILFPTYSAIIPENGMVVVGFAYEGKHYAVVYTPIGFSVTTYTYA